MRWIAFIVPFFLLITSVGLAQEDALVDTDSLLVKYKDDKYLEDQFYIGMVYNVLTKKPAGLTQNNFSNGIMLGFIKDIPLNAERNFGLGLGLGYSTNSFYYNIYAYKENGNVYYDYIGSDQFFERSKIETHAVDIPFEIRWRTSSALKTSFWRVYGGVKFSYVFYGLSKFITDSDKIIFQNPDINKFTTSFYLSFGYKTWNFYGSYAMQPLFESNDLQLRESGSAIEMGYFNVGLIFYIL